MKRLTLELAFVCLALFACESANDDVAATSTSELSNGVQVICQDPNYCPAHNAEVKLVTTNNGTVQNGSWCTGTVIASNRVLTSAKCLTDNVFNPSRICITNRIKNADCDFGAPVSEQY